MLESLISRTGINFANNGKESGSFNRLAKAKIV